MRSFSLPLTNNRFKQKSKTRAGKFLPVFVKLTIVFIAFALCGLHKAHFVCLSRLYQSVESTSFISSAREPFFYSIVF